MVISYKASLRLRALEYAERRALTLGDELGTGVHGSVFLVEKQSPEGELGAQAAVKIHRGEGGYCHERDVYLRLKEHGVETIQGCHVPRLLRHDDELWAIEMTVVSRPYVLDFAGAYLDWRPEFSDEVLADWLVEKQEQFESRWPAAQAILRELEGYGIFVIDVTPSNITLGD